MTRADFWPTSLGFIVWIQSYSCIKGFQEIISFYKRRALSKAIKLLPHKSKGHVGRKSLTKCILVVSQRIGLKNLLRWPPMGITLAMYFNGLSSIKLIP